ncbi:MAG: thioredoxin domain-containing protein [Cellulomonadaceae bacterium]|nr:thioredoxin domain-containing protein [Cellulomonadaceae bacterium]
MANPTLTKKDRREAARLQAAALRAKQEAAEKRNKMVMWAILGVAIVALVGVAIFLALRGDGRDRAPETDSSIALADVANVPSTATDDGGIMVGPNGAATSTPVEGVPTLGVYLDYMCPICGQFEEQNLDAINAMVEASEVNFVLHPVAILDRMSRDTGFSTRSAAIAVWVADRSPENFLAFHEQLFKEQPQENTYGLTNKEMADIALSVLVPQEVVDGIADGTAVDTFAQWVASSTAAAVSNDALVSEDQPFGTPLVAIDGQRSPVNWTTPGALKEAVNAAAIADASADGSGN